MNLSPAWVEEACSQPVGFAQVREDALLDLEVLRGLGPSARVVMVASGGCTVCAIAASNSVEFIHAVDPNPAQLALTRLKLRLLSHHTPEARLSLLGHSNASPPDRSRVLRDILSHPQFPARKPPPPVL